MGELTALFLHNRKKTNHPRKLKKKTIFISTKETKDYDFLHHKTYLGYFIGMTTASLSRRLAFSNPFMLSHFTSGFPRMISLHRKDKHGSMNICDGHYLNSKGDDPVPVVLFCIITYLNSLLRYAFLLTQKEEVEIFA